MGLHLNIVYIYIYILYTIIADIAVIEYHIFSWTPRLDAKPKFGSKVFDIGRNYSKRLNPKCPESAKCITHLIFGISKLPSLTWMT